MHQKHLDMGPDHLLASKFLRCGKLLLFFSRNQLSLLVAWCHLFYQSLCANPWLQTESYSMRMSYVRLLLKINFVESHLYIFAASCFSTVYNSSFFIYSDCRLDAKQVCCFVRFFGAVQLVWICQMSKYRWRGQITLVGIAYYNQCLYMFCISETTASCFPETIEASFMLV